MATLRELALEAGLPIPTADGEEKALEYCRKFFTLSATPTASLTSFLKLFTNLKLILKTAKSLERIAFECVESAARNNVKCLELRYSPQYLETEVFSIREIHSAIKAGIERGMVKYPVEVNGKSLTWVGLICIIDRSMSFASASEVIDFVLANRNDFVGVDLANDELFPATGFAPLFEKCREKGLGITIHAGESGSAANVSEAIHLLGATRIGHGVKILDDPQVVREAKDRNILLEVCPISNYMTSVVHNYEEHPLRLLSDAGLLVSLNSDDPGIFDTDLNDEYEWAATKLGLSDSDFKRMNRNALDASFLPKEVKEALRNAYFEEV